MTKQAEPSGWDVATKLEHSHGGVPCVATAEIRRLQAENEVLRTALAQHYIDQRAKELPELPEPDVYEYDIETAMNVLNAHSPDQLQSYGAACAAQAREVALSDAKREAVKRHSAGEVGAVLISKAIKQLKARK